MRVFLDPRYGRNLSCLLKGLYTLKLLEQARAKYPKVCRLILQGIRCLVESIFSVGLPSHRDYDGGRSESPDKLSASTTSYLMSRAKSNKYTDLSSSLPAKITSDRDRKIAKIIPTGNSVLLFFGEWLFDCTTSVGKMTSSETFYEASAEALGTLCFIFSHNKPDDEFERDYMVRFVIRLTEGLKSGVKQLEKDNYEVKQETNTILVKILQESGSLFKVDLKGMNALLLNYVEMIDMVLERKIDRQDKIREIRGHAIEILLSILCLPLRYPNTPLQYLDTNGTNSRWASCNSMEDLWKECKDILLKALENSIGEEDTSNKSQIMKGLYILLLDKRYDKRYLGQDEYAFPQASPTTKFTREDSDCILSQGKTNSLQSIEQDDYPLYNLWRKMIDLICKILQKHSGAIDVVKFWYVPFGILCGLASTFPYSKHLEGGYQTVIMKLCVYIETLCSRDDPRGQTEDHHTMLAAAFYCLTVWCLHYNDLFSDAEHLFKVCQVIELAKTSKPSYCHKDKEIILKSQKLDKPISSRVGEKAQFLLKQLTNHHPITDHVAYQNTQFSERTLLDYWRSEHPGVEAELRYLVVDKYTILCSINPPVGSHPFDTPVLYQVVRDPYISLSVHFYKYDKSPITDTSPPRQLVPRPQIKPYCDDDDDEYFPDQDLSWPSILSERYSIKSEEKDIQTIKNLQNHLILKDIEKQKFISEEFLRNLTNEAKIMSENLPETPKPTDLQIPECVKKIDSSRLMLAHCGILTPKMFQRQKGDNKPPGRPAVVLLNDSPGLQEKLKDLDNIPTRDCHTVVVLYMKSGQNTVHEILRNKNVLHDEVFCDFLVSLGDTKVDIFKHKGWTGLRPFETWTKADHYTPAPMFPYYSDSFNEMVFIVPNLIPSLEECLSARSSPDLDLSEHDLYDRELREASVEYKPKRSYYQHDILKNLMWDVTPDCPVGNKIVIIWAETFDDTLRFPIQTLPQALGCANESRCIVIFVHPLKSKLFKTNVCSLKSQEKSAKFDTVGLLDDKTKVVSEHVLPTVVRETCLAIRTSSLLEEFSTRPRSRRQNKIIEIIDKHANGDFDNAYFNCFSND